MIEPYAVRFTVGPQLWMTTVGDEDVTERKRHRGRLRAWARQVWKQAKQAGARPVDRYLMLVTVGGRHESPVLAAETLKPIIDAGTDEGLWPDDDPYHRAMTCYLKDPRPLPGGKAELYVWVIPLRPDEDPTTRLLSCAPDAKGLAMRLEFPDRAWLTSNMRLTAPERKRKQEACMRIARPGWRGRSIGAHAGVLVAVRYPDSRPQFKGDPDNTAETATAIWGAGALEGLCPASPSIFAFTLAQGQSEPGHHEMDVLAFTTPDGMDWPSALLGI